MSNLKAGLGRGQSGCRSLTPIRLRKLRQFQAIAVSNDFGRLSVFLKISRYELLDIHQSKIQATHQVSTVAPLGFRYGRQVPVSFRERRSLRGCYDPIPERPGEHAKCVNNRPFCRVTRANSTVATRTVPV